MASTDTGVDEAVGDVGVTVGAVAGRGALPPEGVGVSAFCGVSSALAWGPDGESMLPGGGRRSTGEICGGRSAGRSFSLIESAHCSTQCGGTICRWISSLCAFNTQIDEKLL